ncbi:LuxR C-terminal-related transcriptional regulator [Spongiactinospora sp. TRM90649]|uniref:helix-turn-helix transcriptional regulator n=1 Tax=Spongiactinospora sp. TRM90649 TaxID=3031114 RepID=UPI0023F7145B|nr:LuxR C-terminal-related transcriptional regulator [Spongiactinospora sp. TRM90649]MDF5756914.1 LuxR C-terminal-related transcriptional regulator [Spongiactinospora sp. TRM90649]
MTKIDVPVRGASVIPRTRLLDRLSKGTRGPLTLVTGPPGAGKTTSVSSWILSGRPPGPVAWVSLDPADHTPGRFWPLVTEALLRACGEDLRPEPRGPDGVRGPELAAALAGREQPVVLVLDDFQPKRRDEFSAEIVRLARAAFPALRVVLIARREPPLPLRRLRLGGELTEIGGDDLALGERDLVALLAQHELSLSPRSVQSLLERTEGWAAGLRLAAMTMERLPDPEAFARKFGGEDPAVVGYVAEEVLDPQPADLRRLLLATSVVERFDAELAAELAGPEAARRFPALLRQNGFVLPIGHGWYRYHKVFGTALNLLHRQESAEGAVESHLRASAWFSRRARLAEAVHHAVRAGHWAHAAWLAVDGLAVGQVLGLSAREPLADLLEEIANRVFADEAALPTEPEPALVAAAVALARGHDDVCARWLAHAESLLGRMPGDQAPPARLTAKLIALTRPVPRTAEEIRALAGEAERVLGLFPGGALDERPEAEGLVRYARGCLDLRAGRLSEAAAALGAALPVAEAGGDFQRRRVLGALAVTEALRGRFRQVAGLVARASGLPEVAAVPAGRRVAAVHVAHAWVALEGSRFDEVRAELDRASRALQECPEAVMSALHGLVAARAGVADGAAEESLRILDEAREHTGGMPWLDRRLRLVAAEAYSACDVPQAAIEAANQAGGTGSTDSAVALARGELGRGEVAAASRTLRSALTEATAVPIDVRVEAWLLDAFLAYRMNDRSRGRRSLDRALRLGEREQVRLPFAMARPWLLPVLRRDEELLRPHRRFIDPLLVRQAGAPRPREAPEAAEAGQEPPVFGRLSARELDVLRHLSTMLTTKEIAMEMYVSVNTVKTHLKSIYQKLAVTRRGEAVRRARHLGLL